LARLGNGAEISRHRRSGHCENWADFATNAANLDGETRMLKTLPGPLYRSVLLLGLLIDGGFAANVRAGEQLFVADWENNTILRFDGTSGNYIGTMATSANSFLSQPDGMALGPNGNLYVANGQSNGNNIVGFDPVTGNYLGVFATGGQTPIGMTFGPDGNLYVASRGAEGVLKYNGQTGQSMGVFTAATSDANWPWDVAFGPNGNLFVSSFQTSRVLQFNGSTGSYDGIFAGPGTGQGYASGLTFGSDGNIYVAGFYSNAVYQFNGTNGAFLGQFTSGSGLTEPTSLTFGPDGDLYVASQNSDNIFRYDGTTGQFLGDFTTGGSWSGSDSIIFVDVPEPTSLCLLAVVGSAVLCRRPKTRAKKIH
jgi:sugar lactone lactonase YvrE